MSGTVSATWEHSGLRCVIIRTSMGHLCGYVGVPKSHPLHGHDYSKPHPTLRALWEARKQQPIGENPPFMVLVGAALGGMSDEDGLEPQMCFDVHGGITYSGDLKGYDDSITWAFGFDTAHAQDFNDPKDETYVTAETNKLAEQLASVAVPA